MAIHSNDPDFVYIPRRTTSKDSDTYRYIGAAIPVLAQKRVAADVVDPTDPYEIPNNARLAQAEWIGLMLGMRAWLVDDLCNILRECNLDPTIDDPHQASARLLAFRADERTLDAETNLVTDVYNLACLIWVVTGHDQDRARALALGVPEYWLAETRPLVGGDPHSFIAAQFDPDPQPCLGEDRDGDFIA